MRDEHKRFTPQDLGAFGVGLAVTIAASLLTSMVSPIAFPFNFLVSFGLGGTALYGARKILDPRTRSEIVEQRTEREFREILAEIGEIAKRAADASQSPGLAPETSRHLRAVARMIEMILERYRARSRDFGGASSTLIVLRKFDGVLAHYLKIKAGDLFVNKAESQKVVTQTEGNVIPMIEQALESLGRKLDSGETLRTEVSKGTLESMLRSLDLIESLNDSTQGSPASKEAPDDA